MPKAVTDPVLKDGWVDPMATTLNFLRFFSFFYLNFKTIILVLIQNIYKLEIKKINSIYSVATSIRVNVNEYKGC